MTITATNQNQMQATKVVIPVRFSYVHVFQPTAIADGAEPKYSVSCIIPKSDVKTLEKVRAAIRAAYAAGVPTKFNGKQPKEWKNPLRDGDTARDGDDAYRDSFFINASCRTRPGVVDRNRQSIISEEEFYSGCYGYVSINFYAFNTSGNMGVAAGLNNVMKVKDGEPLGGRQSAESDFADVNTDDMPFDIPEEGADDIFG